jgi:hypothetical protein
MTRQASAISLATAKPVLRQSWGAPPSVPSSASSRTSAAPVMADPAMNSTAAVAEPR